MPDRELRFTLEIEDANDDLFLVAASGKLDSFTLAPQLDGQIHLTLKKVDDA